MGASLVRLLLSAGTELIIVDNLLSAERWNVSDDPRVRFVQGSIADSSVLEELPDDIDYVFHLATFHGNQNSIADPLADHDNNLITTLKLYERLRQFRRLKRVVYAASGCTLAPHTVRDATPVREDGPIPFELDSPYQISKVVGELYSVYYAQRHGLPTVRARFQNVYGPGEILGAGRWRGTAATVWRNVTPTFVYRALKGLSLQLENGGVGTRDFVYVDDIARGLMLCAHRGSPGDVYNLASGVETSIRSLAETINALTNNVAGVQGIPARDWDHSIMRLGSTEKAARELSFETRVRLHDGLERTIEWTRDNLERIEGCIQRHSGELQLNANAYETVRVLERGADR